MIPKYIEKKINMLDSFLAKANKLRYEIEEWAEGRGADICSNEWDNIVVDECGGVNAISKEGLQEYLESL